MIVRFQKSFDKRYTKFNRRLKNKVDAAIEKFRQDPFGPALRNHALHGRMRDRRAFWVTGDIRVIYREFDNHCLVVMLDVGSHSHVY